MLHVSIARGARAVLRCWLPAAALALALAACSNSNSNRGVNSSVGTSTGGSATSSITVTLTSATGTVAVNAGETLLLTATVTNDSSNAGVTWSLTGRGSLSDVTTTTAVYNAPATLSGSATPSIAAISVADTTQGASATLLVNGSPAISPVVLFPATADSAYGASISVAGGVAPFTWTVSSGSLPPGMTAAGNTGTFETISGTPTVPGVYPFQFTATDSNGLAASVDLSLQVNAATSCLLNGQYAFLTSGLSGGLVHVRAASFTIDSSGSLTGIVDRRQSGSSTVAESWTGKCTNRSANSGVLAFVGTTDSSVFNFSVSTSLQIARLQLISGGDSTSASGQLYQQTPADFNLTRLAGSYAFGLLGADPANNNRMGFVGQVTIASSGIVTAGRMDSNGGSALNAVTLTGTMGTPDAYGRGTLNLSGGGQTLQLAYYVVNANRLLLTVADSAANAPRVAGYMTRRVASFNSASLGGSSVLSLWGASGSTQPVAVLSLGRVSDANSGGFSLLLDTADHNKTTAGVAATATSYNVESDGRISMNFTVDTSARQLTGYLDGMSNGYIIERNSSSGNAGLLEAQMDGPYSDTMDGIFVTGTQFPQSPSPLALLPITYLEGGNINSAGGTGYVAMNPLTGRGIGSLQITGLFGSAAVLYVVNTDKMIALRFGGFNQNGALEWMVK